MSRLIYADNAATTQMDIAAFEAMKPFLTNEYGNASQPYAFARKPKKALQDARETIASCIGAAPEEIFFTLLTVAIDCSMGLVTTVSTFSGLAPT